MSRMRTMKPEFFKSRSLAKLPREARMTFAGLWTEADDHGNGIADGRLLKGAIWPLDDDLEPLHVSAHLRMLAASTHIQLYTVGDETYFHIINFEKHQAAAYRRGAPKYPGPDAGQPLDPDPARESVQESAACTQMRAVTGNREQVTGNEETDSAIAAEPDTEPPPVDHFEAFWKAYPRRDGKAAARKAWPKAAKKLTPDRLVNAAAYWARLWSQADVEKRFIPHAATWLNGERWNDEPPSVARASPTGNATDAHFAARFARYADTGAPPTPLALLPGGA